MKNNSLHIYKSISLFLFSLLFFCELEITLPKRDNPADPRGSNYRYPLIGTWERVSGDGGNTLIFLKSKEYSVQSGNFGENFYQGRWFWKYEKSIQIELNDHNKLKTVIIHYYDYDNVQLSWEEIESGSDKLITVTGIFRQK